MKEIEINGEIYVKKKLCDDISIDEHYIDCIAKKFVEMGYSVLTKTKNTKNGSDLNIHKGDLVLRVEAKKARPSKTGNSMMIHPVEKLRENDDLIAVYFPSDYILIEPMKDHFLCCADSGSRSFFGIF